MKDRLVTEADDDPLCEDCSTRSRTGEQSPPPPEDRFGELFKAARVLLREGIVDEDQIIHTLAFAAWSEDLNPDFAHLDDDKNRLVNAKEAGETSWEREADEFLSRYGSLRPIRIIDEILILERKAVGVKIRYDRGTETPNEVLVLVYARRRPPEPEHVASLYSEKLLAAGIPHDESGAHPGSPPVSTIATFIPAALSLSSTNPVRAVPMPRPW